MTPDPDFVKDLEALDPGLSVKWSPGLKLWVIWYKSNGVNYRIHEVKNEDGSYRCLDNRVITMLSRCDAHKKSMQDNIRDIDLKIEEAKKRKKDAIKKSRQEALYRASQMKNKILRAIDNYLYKGILAPKKDKKVISIPGISSENNILLNKLGLPKF